MWLSFVWPSWQKKHEERRQRDKRAARRARDAILRHAEAAQGKANERLGQIENRLAVCNMERKI